MVDYTKWKDLDSDQEEVELLTADKAAFLKNRADEIFSAAECSCDEGGFRKALACYEDLLESLRSNSTGQELARLCRLNIIASLARLGRWEDVIEQCEALEAVTPDLNSQPEELTALPVDYIRGKRPLSALEEVRLRYFKANAFVELYYNQRRSLSPISLMKSKCPGLALTETQKMMTILDQCEEKEALDEYYDLFRRVKDINGDDERSNSQVHNIASVSVHAGWDLLREGKAIEALDWYVDAIRRTTSDSRVSVLHHVGLYSGKAHALLELKKVDQAALSFVEAAGRLKTTGASDRVKAVLLFLQAAELYSDLRESDKSLRCATAALQILENQYDQTLTNEILYLKSIAMFCHGSALVSLTPADRKVQEKAISILAEAIDIFKALGPHQQSTNPLIPNGLYRSQATRLLHCLRSIARAYEYIGEYSSSIANLDLIESEIGIMKSMNYNESELNKILGEALIDKGRCIEYGNMYQDSSVHYIKGASLLACSGQHGPAFTGYSRAGDIFMERAKVSSYDFDNELAAAKDSGVYRSEEVLEAAERGYEAWVMAAEVTKKVANPEPRLALNLSYVRSMFCAGLCALRFDYDLAKRAFEAAQSFSHPQHGTDAILSGDIAFHLAHCYLRLGMKQEALKEVDVSIKNFQSKAIDPGDSKDRIRQAISMKVIVLAALYRLDEAEAVLAGLRVYYASPSQECEDEIIRLRKIIMMSRPKQSKVETSALLGPVPLSSHSLDLTTKPEKEQVINAASLLEAIAEIAQRFGLGFLLKLFKVKSSRRLVVQYDWDYNLISAYAILAASASVLLAIVVPLIALILGFHSDTELE